MLNIPAPSILSRLLSLARHYHLLHMLPHRRHSVTIAAACGDVLYDAVTCTGRTAVFPYTARLERIEWEHMPYCTARYSYRFEHTGTFYRWRWFRCHRDNSISRSPRDGRWDAAASNATAIVERHAPICAAFYLVWHKRCCISRTAAVPPAPLQHFHHYPFFACQTLLVLFGMGGGSPASPWAPTLRCTHTIRL